MGQFLDALKASVINGLAVLVSIRQRYDALYVKTLVCFILLAATYVA